MKFGEKGCKGIVMMKTVEGADKVIEQLNGTLISGFEVKIEKRLTDPTVKPKPKEKDPVLTPIETKVTTTINLKKNTVDAVYFNCASFEIDRAKCTKLLNDLHLNSRKLSTYRQLTNASTIKWHR